MLTPNELFDYITAKHGPTDKQNWEAFSLGGKVANPLDRGLAWNETEYGFGNSQPISAPASGEDLLSESDRVLLVNYRRRQLELSGGKSIGDDKLNCVELVNLLKQS
jgi:hypothetical protein